MNVEITVAIKGGLRKSAKEVLEHSDDLKKTAKNTDEAKEIEEVIKHLEEVAEISEGFGSIKYLIKEKVLDRFGKFEDVLKFENEIRNLDYEVAMFFDEIGSILSKPITQKSSNSVSFGILEINDIIKKYGKDSKKIIVSHNHPTSTGISIDDIGLVIDNKLGGIRAIAKDGSNYLLLNIGKMNDKSLNILKHKIAQRVKNKYPKLVKKGGRKDILGRPIHRASSKKLAQVLTDELVEELIYLKQIEYIKYQ